MDSVYMHVKSVLLVFIISRFGIAFLQTMLWLTIPAKKSENDDQKKENTKNTNESLSDTDKLYIATNQFVETTFLCFILRMGSFLPNNDFDSIYSPSVLLTILRTISFVFRTVLVSLLLLYGDDMLYEPFHRLLHKNKFLYKHIHLHHHQAKRPRRGYVDAINEHPLEMGGALILNAFVILICRPVLNRASLALSLFLKATFAIINHLDRDFCIGFYDAKRHRLHHFFSKIYFGQM